MADGQWNARSMIAEYIREQVKIPRGGICAYIGKGRDVRHISLPFTHEDGEVVYMADDYHQPIYRLKVWVDPEFSKRSRA